MPTAEPLVFGAVFWFTEDGFSAAGARSKGILARAQCSPRNTQSAPELARRVVLLTDSPTPLQVLELLRASLEGDNTKQRLVYKKLIEYQHNPEFNQCLTLVMSQLTSEPVAIRQQAGTILKNSIRFSYEKMGVPVRNYIKQQILRTVGDESKQIRQTVGNIITTIASKDRLVGWQPILAHLVKMLDSQNFAHVDGAFNALAKICEDEPSRLDSHTLGRPLNILIPKFIKFFAHPKEGIRIYALGAVNQFLGGSMPQALRVNLNQYFKGLMFLMKDKSLHIRKRVCQAMVKLLEDNLPSIQPSLRQIIEFMLKATADNKEEVALEACEFWESMCQHRHLDRSTLRPYLGVLVPLLLKGMIYNEMELFRLGADEDDNVPDRDQDIAPRHHSARISSFNGQDDWDDDDDEDNSTWNLRKCSARTLDSLATVYKDELLPHLLPHLKRQFDEKQPWQVCETGVLALGAVAEGCFNGIKAFLPKLVPYLFKLMKHPKPLVRSITCWTLSRYARWIINADRTNDELYFRPLLMLLLQKIQDKNKRVQERACSAFGTVEEEAQSRLLPYLAPILKNLIFAFHKYQAKNMLLLYDAIGMLAVAVGSALSRPDFISILMPPLMQRWHALQDNDRNLYPLLECLACVAKALRAGFIPFAKPVFGRCLQMIHKALLEQHRAKALEKQGHPIMCDVDKELVVCCLDLIGGMAEGLGSSIAPLVVKSRCRLLLRECLRDEDDDVRQSAFGVLGDLAKYCIVHLKPNLNELLKIISDNLDIEHVSVCNNASWALGEIATSVGSDMEKYVPHLMRKLITLLTSDHKGHHSVLENAAIAISRLSAASPDIVAPHLHLFCQPLCAYLVGIQDPGEKELSFRGLCMLIKKNPKGIMKGLHELFFAVASYRNPSQKMARIFYEILHGLKKLLGSGWPAFFRQCNGDIAASLHRTYKL